MATRNDSTEAVTRHPQAGELESALRAWWANEQGSWDVAVDEGQASKEELWDDMPELDSKMVTRASKIFEEHLGVPLRVELIRPGGYTGIDEMIDHLVPAMVEFAMKSAGNGAGRDEDAKR